MKKEVEKKEYVFDATGKSLGRLATEIATVLRGKNLADYQANTYPDLKVIIENASKVNLNASQLKKLYKRYSGYPGGLTEESMAHLIERKGYKDIFEKAVRGMLPSNKLRDRMMKNLIVKE